MRLIPLRSSQLASVGFNPETETMVAQFQKNGTVYRYNGVTAETFVAIITDTESHGRCFNQKVRNTDIPFEKIEPEDVERL